MTIEASLDRIAVAIENLAALLAPGAAPAAKPTAEPQPQAKRSAGRPAKSPAPVAEQPAETVAEPDPFDVGAAADPEPVYTRENVRDALVSYQKRVSPERARKLLKDVGGVDTLGTLPEAKFAAVIAATKAA